MTEVSYYILPDGRRGPHAKKAAGLWGLTPKRLRSRWVFDGVVAADLDSLPPELFQ